jgi:biopolymer transport protein TolR
MGMSSGSSKKSKVISEINVTPLVDVMLVLLIIFMISAPLMYSGVHLKLPKTAKNDSVNLNKQQVILSITKSGEFYLGDVLSPVENILQLSLKKLKDENQENIFVRADADTPYHYIAKVMSLLKNGGIQNISLITEVENKTKK